MEKQIEATKVRAGQTLTKTFNKITWDLLPANKDGWEQVKSAKAPEEVKKKSEPKDDK